MKKFLKSSLIVLLTFGLSLALFSCKDKSFSLILSENLYVLETVNLEKLTKGTNVTIVVSVPEDKELDYLLVNGKKVVVTDNTYTFKVTENSVALVYFKDMPPVSEDIFYQLTVSKYVSVNVEDLEKVAKDTLVVVTVNVPKNRVFEKLIINNETITTLTNNQYTFLIDEDTDVDLVMGFEDGWKAATSANKSLFLLNINSLVAPPLIKGGMLNLSMTSDYSSYQDEVNGLVELDKDLNIKEMQLALTKEKNNLPIELINYYYDGTDNYLQTNNLTTEEITQTKFSIDFDVVDFQQLVELLLGSEIDFINTFGDFNAVMLSMLKLLLSEILVNEKLKDNVFLLTKGLEHKVFIDLDNTIIDTFKDTLNLNFDLEIVPEFSILVEIYFKNSSITKVNFKFVEAAYNSSFNLTFDYTDQKITPPTDLADYEEVEITYYNYNLYFADLPLSIKIPSVIIEYLDNNNYFEIIDEQLEKLDQFSIEGLYTDKDYLNPFKAVDLLIDDLSIYIKWEEKE